MTLPRTTRRSSAQPPPPPGRSSVGPAKAAGPARTAAFDVLLEVETGGALASSVLERVLAHSQLDVRDRAFVTELVDGTLRWRGRLDHLLAAISTHPLENLPAKIRTVLRMGAYQIVFLDRVPDSAAVDEAVALAHRHSHAGTAGLVNAVLRRLSREHGTIAFPDPTTDPAGYLSTAASHPRWLIERWLPRFGFADTEALCRVNNSSAPVTLRANRLRTTREALLEELRALGLDAAPGTLDPEAIRVTRGGSPFDLPAFREGRYSVQGEGSALVARLVAPQPGWRIADLCAGTGGKTTHLAELMNNTGAIVAGDVQSSRLRALTAQCRRLGITIIETRAGDARKLAGERTFDAVLLDAPCSGTGALRRRPDLRWRLRPEQIGGLVTLQTDLLRAAARLVRPGGVVVYATCSLEDEENAGVVAAVLAEGALSVEDPRPYLPALTASQTSEGVVRLSPAQTDTDGMFMARLVRRQ